MRVKLLTLLRKELTRLRQIEHILNYVIAHKINKKTK